VNGSWQLSGILGKIEVSCLVGGFEYAVVSLGQSSPALLAILDLLLAAACDEDR